MTEGSFDDGNYLVRVRAQVMTRDDSSGGWVPMGGGGLSNVSVRKRIIPSEDNPRHEYFIYGKRIVDQSVVLSCTLKKDFQYNRVMPTFYHWRTGNKKFGLTFQTAADARAFDKGVRLAVNDFFDGTGESSRIYETDLGDDEVFMTLDLPVDSRSSSGSSTASGSIPGFLRPSSTTTSITGDLLTSASPPFTHPHANHHYLHRIHYIRPARTVGGSTSGNSGVGTAGGSGSHPGDKGHIEEIWEKDKTKTFYKEQMFFDSDKIETIPTEPYSYVQFAKDKPSRTEHEYSYPVMDSFRLGKRDSINSLKKHQNIIATQPPLLPTKCKKKKDRHKETRKQSPLTRIHCRYCQEMYNEEDNRRGSCEYAPDCVLSCINATTCISCAQCMLYHCMSDAEGDFSHHPCSCDNSDNQCRRRWFGLALLSLFVPCLWCYIPLQACHHCGVRCNLCGGKHDAA